MTEEVDFLFDADLVAAVINLIRSAKNKLLLISPFIDLDARVMDALNEKKTLHNFELQILFGKNENNYLRSIKRDSLEFFKGFPNVEIRYNERLHAKFYQNDFEYIMTSLNLYDYSLANNIEVGIKSEYALKGVLGKAFEVTGSFIGQGVDKVKQDVLGMDKKVGPIEKFRIIYESSELKYKTQPVVVEKEGLQGWIGGKKLDGFEVLVDKLNNNDPNSALLNAQGKTALKTQVSITVSSTISKTIQVKYMSASQLGKSIGIQAREITFFMQKRGLINDDKITEAGEAKGLIMKSYMGNDYIAYPDNLVDLEEIKNK